MPVGAGFIPARIGENKKMTEHKKLQPEIRFAGFTDDWEQCKLGSILKVKSGMSQKGIEVPNGQYPILATGGEIGRTNTAIYDKESVLIGRKGTIDKPYYMNSPFWTVDTLFYTELSVNIFALFIYYLFQKIGWKSYDTSTGVPSLTSSTIHNISVWIPKSKEEQTQIGNFFKQLDDTITLHQRTLEKYQKLKISYLEKMFPKENELYPELRFPNFTDAWEQRKFLDNIESIIDFRGRTPRKLGMEWGESGYLALSALNVKNGYIDPSVDAHFGDEALYQKWMTGNELKQGQVLFTTEAPMGNVAQIPDDKKYILSQRTIAFNIKEKYITDDFLAVLLRSPNVFNDLDSLSSGGTAKGISQKSLSNLYVKVPNSLEEQTQIGNFFKQLDDTIALHQREVKKYKKIKQSYLEKMFI